MKKTTILILVIVMGISFISLLYLQVRYIEEIVNMRREHFSESVERSLYQTSHQLEVAETARYLENGIVSIEYKAHNDSTCEDYEGATQKQIESDEDNEIGNSFTEGKNSTIGRVDPSLRNKYFTKRRMAFSDKQKSLNEIFKSRYSYEKRLIDEVIYSLLYDASDRPLEDRIDFRELDQILKSQLHNNGIDIPYHFTVLTSNGQIVYRCPEYDKKGEEISFTESLFRNDPVQKIGVLKVHFPTLNQYIYKSIWFLVPSLTFSLVLLVTFIVTLVLVFRQKKLTEVKNDFINNMTHEFKTPISTISLAAQMLNDSSITKSPQMITRLSTTINDETKRLRFQVEKVLQLSMYENQSANLKMKEVNVNELIAGVIHTFTLKVEKNGGKIISNLQAEESTVLADDMHLTNVIFNLMDNAVKYRRNDIDLELQIKTWDEDKKLCISIQDNGIGIKKDDLKKIFEKFYRVHTGNLHDVKGFGLGLAYVKKIITDHKGTIHAESELGIGTKFIIKLPLLKE